MIDYISIHHIKNIHEDGSIEIFDRYKLDEPPDKLSYHKNAYFYTEFKNTISKYGGPKTSGPLRKNWVRYSKLTARCKDKIIKSN